MPLAEPTPVEVMAVLASPEGRRLIAAAGDAVSAYPDPLAAMTTLRRRETQTHPAVLAAAMTQVELRHRHGDRLGPHVGELLLTIEGAQQATRWVVAQHRAGRLRDAGATAVADLGCGLGLDLRAMKDAGLTAVGVEHDPVTAVAADANVPGARVIIGDCTNPEVLTDALADTDAVFVDPARRDPSGPRDARGGRVHPERDPALWSPPWPWVVALAQRGPRVVAKVAPGMPTALVPAGSEIEWVSVDGDLVEACVWFPPIAADNLPSSGTPRTDPRRDGRTLSAAPPAQAPPAAGHQTTIHRATVIDSTTGIATSLADSFPPSGTPRTDPGRDGRNLSAEAALGHLPAPGDLLLEPDPAIVRAGLVDQLTTHLAQSGLAHSARIFGTDLLIAPTGPSHQSERPPSANSPSTLHTRPHLTVGDAVPSPFVSTFRIIATVPTRDRDLRILLEGDGFGDLVVKVRGLQHDATAFSTRARLRGPGGPRATVVLLPDPDGRPRGYLVEPLARTASRAI